MEHGSEEAEGIELTASTIVTRFLPLLLSRSRKLVETAKAIDGLARAPEEQGKALVGSLEGVRIVRQPGEQFRVLCRVDAPNESCPFYHWQAGAGTGHGRLRLGTEAPGDFLEKKAVRFALLCCVLSSSVAAAQDCPVVESVIPLFHGLLLHSPEMGDPGSTMEFVMALSVDPLGRPAAVEFLEGPPWQWLRDVLWETARQWRFEPIDTYPPARTIQLTFRFRTLPWPTPAEELNPIVDGCTVEVRAQGMYGRFRGLNHIPEAYHYLYKRSIPSGEHARIVANLPYDSITLERTPGATTTFFRDGRARFEGGTYAERQGTYEGEVSIWDYGLLCYAIEAFGFFELAPHYSIVVTHASRIVLKVTMSADAREVQVSDYANQGPPELWVLAKAIDGVAAGIDWKRVKGPQK